ncbi:MAG: glycosyl hydrolase family 28-related protein [Thermoguttaceae bacterium]|jgi:hypothetical protein|nr:glycosyl hydrolase family 28-related protein [Thermoguttaceae bacterium]
MSRFALAVLVIASLRLTPLMGATPEKPLNVRDFGATGDGTTNDTAAVQRAIDALPREGGGVLTFPKGTYLVTSVKLIAGATYRGEEGAVVKRPAKLGKWDRTFVCHYSGDHDSQPLVVRDLTFDGNSEEQGPYRRFELEQAHLVFLAGDRKKPGRLNALVENCRFINGVADGISVYTNVNAKVRNCEATDVFRGGFVLTGGNSTADVDGLTTGGNRCGTGIDIEVDGKGYGGTLKVEVNLRNLKLLKGDFDVGVSDGSVVTGENITAGAPFYIYSRQSKMHFKRCSFEIGACDGYLNRICVPWDVRFEDCEFTLTRKVPGRHPFSFFAVADVFWNFSWLPPLRHQRLTFDRCRFGVDKTIKPEDVTYVVYERGGGKDDDNVVTLTDCQIAPGFTKHRHPAP